MSNRVAGDSLVIKLNEPCSFVRCDLEDHTGKAHLENDLDGYQASECIEVTLFRGA